MLIRRAGLAIDYDKLAALNYIQRCITGNVFIEWKFSVLVLGSSTDIMIVKRKDNKKDSSGHDYFDTIEDFLVAMKERHPKDFTMLLFHPEIFQGKYYADK